MSNDSSPRARLTDLGFVTTILDPRRPWSWSAQLKCDTTMSRASGALVPSKFGFAESVPTQESDIYASGLANYQVRNRDRGCLSCTYAIQALAGEVPFRDFRMGEMPVNVAEGKLSPTPKNASDLVFSDSLWDFAQRCWDGKFAWRPRIAEVVSQLGEAAAAWNGAMALYAAVEDVVSETQESEPDVAYCKFIS